MHSRREDAFKEGLGGIQEELMRTRKKSRIVLYYIDLFGKIINLKIFYPNKGYFGITHMQCFLKNASKSCIKKWF